MQQAQWHFWFSLIELIVVMTIIAIISMWIYLPYSHHQKITLVKQWANEISSSIHQARNMAIHGMSSWTWNLHVGLEFQKDHLVYNWYLLSNTWSVSNILQTKKLPRGVWVDDDHIGQEFLFEAINWELMKRDSDWDIINLSNEETVSFSYMWSEASSLRSEILYHTRSHISEF